MPPKANLPEDIEKNDDENIDENSIEEPLLTSQLDENSPNPIIGHKGKMLIDATVAPQNIAYPTDLDLLNACRQKTELIIDKLWEYQCQNTILGALRLLVKPRTYRENARKDYLNIAQSKKKTQPKIRKAVSQQLSYLKRNLANIEMLLGPDSQPFPLDQILQRYLWVIKTCHSQQLEMYEKRTHKVDDRIVSIHQPHVRPIVRGKATAKVEFGSKISVSLVDGMSYLDRLSWDAFNEGATLMDSIELYRKRHGCYPEAILADQIYCTRENRKALKLLGILLKAKPLGRPKAVPEQHVSPGERNPIEGKFGQAKRGYGMNNILAKLKQTSEAWVAMIVLVLNLVKLAGQVPLWLKSEIDQAGHNLIYKLININWIIPRTNRAA